MHEKAQEKQDLLLPAHLEHLAPLLRQELRPSYESYGEKI